MMPDAASVPRPLVVMGVAGCGKSSLAAALGQALGRTVIEGDDFHPPRNKDLMHRGIALTDEDRADWLDALGAELQRLGGRTVLSCSALKRAYRDRLRAAAPGLRFVYLELDEDTALARVRARASTHFFNAGLVRSQFATLEPPRDEPDAWRLDATEPLPVLRDAVLDRLARDLPSRPLAGQKDLP